MEGPTDDPAIKALRERPSAISRHPLLLAGRAMLLAGDEMGRTQLGNNNAYCQDNTVSWVHWDLNPEARQLLEFTQRIIALRNAHPLFRRRTFFRGRAARDLAVKDVTWLTPGGKEMTDEEWNQSFARCLSVFLHGGGLTERDERGRPVQDDDLLLLLNAHHDEVPFTLPGEAQVRWNALTDTSAADGTPVGEFLRVRPIRYRAVPWRCWVSEEDDETASHTRSVQPSSLPIGISACGLPPPRPSSSASNRAMTRCSCR